MTNHIGDADEQDHDLRSRLLKLEPPPRLEERVSASLGEAGLLARPASKRLWSASLFRIAAGLLLFAAGMAARPAWNALVHRETRRGERFALLLYEGDSQALLEDDVSAHRLWARKLADSGHEVSGEKLSGFKVELTPTAEQVPSASIRDLEGFFVISAASEAEATAIARSSPHFQHGGLVVVKRIDPT